MNSEPYSCERVVVPTGVLLENAIAYYANHRARQGLELVSTTTINGEVYMIFRKADEAEA